MATAPGSISLGLSITSTGFGWVRYRPMRTSCQPIEGRVLLGESGLSRRAARFGSGLLGGRQAFCPTRSGRLPPCYRGPRGGGHGPNADRQHHDSRWQRGRAVSRRRAGRGPAHRGGSAGRGSAAARRARDRRRRRDVDARAHRAARPRQLSRRALELGLHEPSARRARPDHDAQRQDDARLRLYQRAVGRLGQAAPG